MFAIYTVYRQTDSLLSSWKIHLKLSEMFKNVKGWFPTGQSCLLDGHPSPKNSLTTLNDQILVGLLLVQITMFKNKAASASCIVQQGYLWLFCIQYLISLGISFYSLVWEWGQKCLKSNMMINAN